MLFLAGDIGGTKTRLALFDDELHCKRQEIYASKDFPHLEDIVKLFLKEKVAKACFGVAGPVVEGRCQTTNLPWILVEKDLEKVLKIPKVSLINDLEANAWATFCLQPAEIFTVQKGTKKNGTQAVIAAGTGLGEAGLYWDGKKHHPFASEGGHTDFGARNEVEMELYRYLRKKFDHISYERILSGPGIYNIYRFLIDLQLEKDEEEIRLAFANKDPAKVITEKAVAGESKACVKAVEWFVSLYGGEAGNLALKYLAIGGVYIGGGIAPNILPFFKKKIFLESFLSKGRFRELLSEIPVHVILNERAALLGAAKYCLEL